MPYLHQCKWQRRVVTQQQLKMELWYCIFIINSINYWKQFNLGCFFSWQEELIQRLGELQSIQEAQIEELIFLKNKISKLESLVPTQKAESYSNNIEITPRASTPPTSCTDLWGFGNFVGMDGIYLIQNKATNKIQAVFCQFISTTQSKNDGLTKYYLPHHYQSSIW